MNRTVKNKCEELVRSTRAESLTPNVSRLINACTKAISTVNSVSTVYASIVNAKVEAYITIIDSYNKFMNSIIQ